jgi:putative glutamine amidotransferase
VTSHHRQAVRDAGSMRVLAHSPDGVIEAIERPGARFQVGVQWHPERTEDPALGLGLFEALVQAARRP